MKCIRERIEFMKNRQHFKGHIAKLCILCLVMSMFLSACGSTSKETSDAKTKKTKNVTTVIPTPTVAPTVVPTEVPVADLIAKDWPKDFSLYKTYKDDFFLGTIYTDASRSGTDKELTLKQFNTITPENLMKPEYMQPTEGNFNYSEADTMFQFAKENNLNVHAHTLVWHNQSGDWLGKNVSREKAIEQLKSHITNIVKHYKGKAYSWDVVNEAINDGVALPANGDWKSCLRQTQWLDSIGPDYIAMAFKFAHEADPNAKLYYNDYSLNDRNKADIVCAMVKDLKSQGIAISGIGMQGHYSIDTSVGSVEYSIQKFIKLKVEISVSELDVAVKGAAMTGLTKDQEIRQGIFYAKLFQVYKKYSKSIARVTFWGYVDNKSWIRQSFPCLFNADYSPKLAAYAVLDPDKFLKLYQTSDQKKVVSTAKAYYGTPKIDGEIDKLWDNCPKAQINNAIQAWQGAKGTVRLLWDKSFVYALFEITDAELNDSSQNAYEQDSIEVFLDQNNDKNSFLDDNDGQYRVNYKGVESFGTVPAINGFKSFAKQTNDGYLIELAIPLLKNAKQGKVMGFEAQINDANSFGKRQSVMKFNDLSDNSYQSTENWGNLELTK